MINEGTKTIPGVNAKKHALQSASSLGDCQNVSHGDNSAQQHAHSHLSALSLERQQYLLSEGSLHKCTSGDSLSSLQQFASSSPSSPSSLSLAKRFIAEDNSDYTLSSECDPVSLALFNVNSTSSTVTNFLRPRMEFTGYQISGYKKYQVVVTLKTVDLPKDGISSLSPHLTGFLTIKGLTNQHPEISTYFESFAVTHKDLGFLSSTWSKDTTMDSYKADDQTDLEHWLNFPSFKQLFLNKDSESERTPTINDLLDGQESFDNYLEGRYIFMRWKEKFLVPDALIDGVEGASYDGFYYIVHDQVTGTIQGFYYHQDAEKFQQLELVPSFKSLNDCSNCTYEFA